MSDPTLVKVEHVITEKYRFTPELIPVDLWGRSVYQMLGGKAVWKSKIRPDAINAADNRCQICADRAARLVCHEKWKYDDKTQVATLIGFEVHCDVCDMVTHLGRAGVMGDPERVVIDALQTLCAVNECEPQEAEQYPELEELPTFKPTQ